MSNYTYVKNLDGWRGVVKAYRHNNGGQDIVISRANTFDRGDETMIFEFDLQSEQVLNWTDLYAGYGETHEEALNFFENESGDDWGYDYDDDEDDD